jgi:hypothetical protein
MVVFDGPEYARQSAERDANECTGNHSDDIVHKAEIVSG